jgi:hypothetical protein
MQVDAGASLEFWAKLGAAIVAFATALKYVVQIGVLLNRLDTLTREVERLRDDIEDLKERLK